jgi:type IV secretion system protein VirB3
MDAPQKLPIHPSCNRPHLLFGADREAVIIAGMGCCVLAWSWLGGTLTRAALGFLLSAALWVIVVAILQRLAKADPLMIRIYVRHRRYQDFYPARSPINAEAPVLPKRWPKS